MGKLNRRENFVPPEIDEEQAIDSSSSVITNLIFPTRAGEKEGRVNWCKNLAGGYLFCGVTYIKDKGCSEWILETSGGKFVPVLEWGRWTEAEIVDIIDLIKGKRGPFKLQEKTPDLIKAVYNNNREKERVGFFFKRRK
ncbi:MAG: hypothetical protein WC302_00800 [Candidatus Paceibacterota bacterium]|jgi:hypothetical protein